MLTKSLHTITAATNVAAYIILSGADRAITGDLALARAALAVLGYSDISVDRSGNDPTVAKIVANCAKLLSQGPRRGIYQNDVAA